LKDIKFIICDIDGTILDSKKFFRNFQRKIIVSNPFFSQIYLKVLEGKILPKIIKKWLYELTELTERNEVKKFRGVTTFLRSLNKKRIKVFGSTRSNLEKTKRRLEEQKILKFFEILAGNEVEKIKHIPYFAEYLNMEVKEFSKQALYIGDEPGDIYIAKKSEIPSIIITSTFTEKELERLKIERVAIVKKIKEAVKK
jgi:HAD superfamily hydrolase (TIGR01549 family)